MVRSSLAELADLRRAVAERALGICEWPGCDDGGRQMAHLTHRGMGGSTTANTMSNLAWLCIRHHDTLDGRTSRGTLRYELNELLRHVITR